MLKVKKILTNRQEKVKKKLTKMSLGDNIKALRELGGIKVPEFARKFGFEKVQVYAWEKNEYVPSKENLKRLADAFDITEQELRFGKKSVSKNLIPFYDALAVGGSTMLADQSSISEPAEMVNPGSWFKSASGAIRVYGHSMFPKYPSGSIVAFKTSDIDVILWGEDYVIELEDRRILKRLEKCDVPNCVKAVSYNKSEEYVYSPIEIPKGKIKRLYMVLGKIELEASI